MTKTFNSQKWSKILYYFWIYTLLVILWGAWVRISHSGDGCGDHWPLCSGEFIPDFKERKTWVEYGHRLMSGLYGLFVFYIFYVIRKSPVSSTTKRLNWGLLFFMLTEAALGALLVKGQLVTTNDSFQRLIVMSFHQLNSFLLTGVTFMYYLSIKNGFTDQGPKEMKIKSLKPFIFFILLAVSGAIAALSTTLFPTISLWQGILQDFSMDSHLFVRLRIIHPILALSIATGFLIWLQMNNYSRVALEFLVAIAIGVITLLTLSPVALKLTHLLVAHLLWARLFYLFVSSPDSSKR